MTFPLAKYTDTSGRPGSVRVNQNMENKVKKIFYQDALLNPVYSVSLHYITVMSGRHSVLVLCHWLCHIFCSVLTMPASPVFSDSNVMIATSLATRVAGGIASTVMHWPLHQYTDVFLIECNFRVENPWLIWRVLAYLYNVKLLYSVCMSKYSGKYWRVYASGNTHTMLDTLLHIFMNYLFPLLSGMP